MNHCVKAKELLAFQSYFQRIIYLSRALHAFFRVALKLLHQHKITISPESILLVLLE